MATDTSLEQYDLPDSQFDPELDAIRGESAAEPKPEAELEAKPDAPEAPRGQGGKFHSPRVVAQAKALGIDEEEIQSLSPRDLRESVRDILFERAIQTRETNQHNAHSAPAVPSAPSAPVEPARNEQDELDWGQDEEGNPLKESDYPKHVAALMKTVHDQAKRLKAIESSLGQVRGYVEGQARQTQAQIADKFFAQHPDLFGEGTVDDVDRESVEFERRALVIGKAMKLDAKVPFPQRLKKAAALFGVTEKAKPAPASEPSYEGGEDEPIPAKGRITPEQWKAGRLGPATSRNGSPEPKGDRRAAKGVARLMSEKGWSADDLGGVEEQGLP